MSNLQKKENPSAAEQFKLIAKQTFTKKDGTLNPVSVGLTALIVLLLAGLTGTVLYKTSPKSMQENIVNGLSSEEAQKAIQNAFLAGLDGYVDGDMSDAEVRKRLYEELAKLVEKNGAFTDDQRAELLQTIEDYINNLDLDSLVKDNTTAINDLTREFNNYLEQNEKTLETLKATLQKEIETNKNYTQEQLDILKELQSKLEKLEASHFNELENKINDSYRELYELTQNTIYKDMNSWDASKSYKIDDYVIYNNQLYRNVTGESTSQNPELDTINWKPFSVMKTVENNYITYINGMYQDVPEWEPNKEYKIDEYVTYNNKVYQNITGNNTSTNPAEDTTNWVERGAFEAITNVYNQTLYNIYNNTAEWSKDGVYKIDDYVIYKNKLYRNITGEYTSTNPAEDTVNWEQQSLTQTINNNYQTYLEGLYGSVNDWSADGEYKIDDYVMYKNKIYVNITGEYTSSNPSEDKANWKQVSTFEQIINNYNTYLTGMYGDTAEWSADGEYKIDNYVLYKNKIYRNITGEYTSTNPAEDTVNWKEASAFGEINNNYQTFIERLYSGIEEYDPAATYKLGTYVMYNNQLYKNTTGNNTGVTPDIDTANWKSSSMITIINNVYNTYLSTTGATEYDPNTDYNAGDYVVYENIIYKNVSDNPSTGDSSLPGSSDAWKATTITQMIDENYNTFVNVVGAEDYNPAHDYQVGDYVIYNNHLYRNETGGSGVPGSSGDWSSVSVTDQVESLQSQIEELELQSSLNLDAVNKNLIDMITNNQSLTEEQRQQMLNIINNNADASQEGLQALYDKLLAVINSQSNENTKEREKLLEQMNALEDNTASYMDDYEKRIKMLEDKSKASTAPTSGTDNSGEGADFDFGYQGGAYGYWADGVFHPL